ncbi:MAG: acyl-CoA dehydrogenase family protein, partial [Gemmatimonadetes bacterium]|nr:acyl-CoA dehydrogenase family protein [Gemmatimonadota bacterium]
MLTSPTARSARACRRWSARRSSTRRAFPSTSSWFELGLMGIQVPEQYGGAGGSLMMVTIAVEEISKADAAAAIMVDVQNTLVLYPMLTYASDEQKARYLPRLCTDMVGAYAL